MFCQYNGLFADPKDCGTFYQCVYNGNGAWIIYTNKCDPGTVFNPSVDTCDWPRNVPGCESYPN